MSMINISDLSMEELKDLLTSWGQPSFHANQIHRWLYQRLASSFEEMTDLPKALRERLSAEASTLSLAPVQEITSGDGQTTRVLFKLGDDRTIESVLMLYDKAANGRERHTVCVSTQVGCAIGCRFCATGQQGFERNLSPGEMVDQVLYFAQKMRRAGLASNVQSVTNVVFMGMGEPLANYDATLAAVRTLNSPNAFGLGARHMTISTVGVVPGIKRLEGEDLQIGLAISLHAADDETRSSLVPLNRRYPVKALISAARDYFEHTGRRPTFEYVLLNGVNDSPADAKRLAHLLDRLNCSVNLIAVNSTGIRGFRAPPKERVAAFQAVLNQHDIPSTIRQSRGGDIEAGCGQLRSRFLSQAR